MKFAVIADLHLHNHREFGRTVEFNNPWDGKVYPANSRLVDQLNTLNDLFHRLFEKGIKLTYIAGDIFHVRGTVPSDVLQLSLSLFQFWSEKGMKFRAIAGNHDQMDAEGLYHSSSAFANVFDVATGSKRFFRTRDEDGATMVHLLPWVENRHQYLEELDFCQQLVRTNPHCKHVLISHAGIDGAEVGTLEYRLKEPVFVEDLGPDLWAAVFLGHFHKPQKMANNVWYVGSPYQITRAEREDVKRAMIYDTETAKVTQFKTVGKQFYQMFFDDMCHNDPDTWKPAPGYYDVIVRGKEDPAEVRAILAEMGVPEFHLIRPRVESAKKSRMKVSKKATDRQLLEAFLQAKGVESTEEVLEAGLTCLQGTSSHGSQAKEIVFESVKVRNFMSLSKANLTLHQPGSVIAVLGENLDAAGFESNGSGKSSLLPESIFWCLYGSTIRDIPVDRVVNSIKKRNCSVQLTLCVDSQDVVVTRYRKHEDHGNTLMLSVGGVDHTQGTNALTQARLDSLIGMNLDAFNSIMAFSPGSLNFVSATDASKKQILDSILHTERYVEAAARAKQFVKSMYDTFNALGTELQGLSSDIKAKDSNVKSLLEQDEEQAVRLKTYSRETKAKLRQFRADIAKIADDQLSPLEDELKEVMNKAGELRSQIPDMSDLLDAQAKTGKNLRDVEHTLVEMGVKESTLSTNIGKMMKQTGRECPTCKQVIDGKHVGKISAKMDRELTELKKQMEPLEQQRLHLSEALANMNLSLRKGEAVRQEVGEWTKKLESKQSMKRRLESEIKDISLEITSLEGETPQQVDYQRMIKGVKEEITELGLQLDTATEQQRELGLKLATYKLWVDWFGNKGIKSFMLDRVIPALTDYANEFADQLTDGDIKIEFESGSDGNDKFQINAINSEGSDIYGGNSSGERRRIDICVMFALFRLANEQTNINVLLLDEVFDTVDTTGLERIVTMIHTLARELELTIFVTSHTDLRKWLHDSIIVSKQDRMAVLKTIS